jgi:hypothetical protein
MISQTNTVYFVTLRGPIDSLCESNSVFSFLNGPFNCSDYVPSNRKVVNEFWFRKMFKDVAVAYFTARCRHMFGDAEETHETLRIMCLQVQIWNRELQITNQGWQHSALTFCYKFRFIGRYAMVLIWLQRSFIKLNSVRTNFIYRSVTLTRPLYEMQFSLTLILV